jgi:hypothetical protein
MSMAAMHAIGTYDSGRAHIYKLMQTVSSSCNVCHYFHAYELELDDGNEFESGVPWDGVSLGGYASKLSVAQGEIIDFHISTDLPVYSISIWREGETRTLMQTIEGLMGGQHDCTGGYATGCNWPTAHSLEVPEVWPSGVYTVDIPTSSRGKQNIIFWVREDKPGSTSSMIFLSSVDTYNAYTTFGGKSLYANGMGINGKSSKVSFNRPFNYSGLNKFPFEMDFVSWAEKSGYRLEYATTYDIHFMPDLLKYYQVVVISHHSEYWSWNMRQRMKEFIENGGRLVNLSGNTMWWQVRFEDNGRTLVCYKDYAKDPKPQRKTATDNAWDYPVFDVESSLIGGSWILGGFFNFSRSDMNLIFRQKDGYGGFWVQNASHWVYEGTGLKDGDVFGRGAKYGKSILGTESDGAAFNCAADGKTVLGPLPHMGTPKNFTILGISPVAPPPVTHKHGQQVGFATMGIYTNAAGGAVFSGNTMGWQKALDQPAVNQVTRNVLDRFLSKDFPQEIPGPDVGYLFYDRCNCKNLYSEGVLSGYDGPKWYSGEGIAGHNFYAVKGNTDSLKYTEACGIGNGSGLRVLVNPKEPVELRTQLKPDWGGVATLYGRVYLDFSNLTMQEGDAFIFMKQLSDGRKNDEKPKNQAVVKIRLKNGALQLRYVDWQTNDGSPWVEIPRNQAFLLETMRDRQTGQLTLWVDGVAYEATLDLSESESVNRIDICLGGLDEGVGGSFCLDELAFSESRIGPFSD